MAPDATYLALTEDMLLARDTRAAARLRLVLEYGDPPGPGVSLRTEARALGASEFLDRDQAIEFLRREGGGYLLDGESPIWIGRRAT